MQTVVLRNGARKFCEALTQSQQFASSILVTASSQYKYHVMIRQLCTNNEEFATIVQPPVYQPVMPRLLSSQASQLNKKEQPRDSKIIAEKLLVSLSEARQRDQQQKYPQRMYGIPHPNLEALGGNNNSQQNQNKYQSKGKKQYVPISEQYRDASAEEYIAASKQYSINKNLRAQQMLQDDESIKLLKNVTTTSCIVEVLNSYKDSITIKGLTMALKQQLKVVDFSSKANKLLLNKMSYLLEERASELDSQAVSTYLFTCIALKYAPWPSTIELLSKHFDSNMESYDDLSFSQTVYGLSTSEFVPQSIFIRASQMALDRQISAPQQVMQLVSGLGRAGVNSQAWQRHAFPIIADVRHTISERQIYELFNSICQSDVAPANLPSMLAKIALTHLNIHDQQEGAGNRAATLLSASTSESPVVQKCVSALSGATMANLASRGQAWQGRDVVQGMCASLWLKHPGNLLEAFSRVLVHQIARQVALQHYIVACIVNASTFYMKPYALQITHNTLHKVAELDISNFKNEQTVKPGVSGALQRVNDSDVAALLVSAAYTSVGVELGVLKKLVDWAVHVMPSVQSDLACSLIWAVTSMAWGAHIHNKHDQQLLDFMTNNIIPFVQTAREVVTATQHESGTQVGHKSKLLLHAAQLQVDALRASLLRCHDDARHPNINQISLFQIVPDSMSADVYDTWQGCVNCGEDMTKEVLRVMLKHVISKLAPSDVQMAPLQMEVNGNVRVWGVKERDVLVSLSSITTQAEHTTSDTHKLVSDSANTMTNDSTTQDHVSHCPSDPTQCNVPVEQPPRTLESSLYNSHTNESDLEHSARGQVPRVTRRDWLLWRCLHHQLHGWFDIGQDQIALNRITDAVRWQGYDVAVDDVSTRGTMHVPLQAVCNDGRKVAWLTHCGVHRLEGARGTGDGRVPGPLLSVERLLQHEGYGVEWVRNEWCSSTDIELQQWVKHGTGGVEARVNNGGGSGLEKARV